MFRSSLTLVSRLLLEVELLLFQDTTGMHARISSVTPVIAVPSVSRDVAVDEPEEERLALQLTHHRSRIGVVDGGVGGDAAVLIDLSSARGREELLRTLSAVRGEDAVPVPVDDSRSPGCSVRSGCNNGRW